MLRAERWSEISNKTVIAMLEAKLPAGTSLEQQRKYIKECIEAVMQRLMAEGCQQPSERESPHPESSMANRAAAATMPVEVPLIRSSNTSGYRGVTYNPLQRARKRPFQANDKSGKSLGMYATAEAAAAAYSRNLGFAVAAELAAAVESQKPPLTSAEALQLAADEELHLPLHATTSW
eukprot:337132-Prymnesium_polylepis.1